MKVLKFNDLELHMSVVTDLTGAGAQTNENRDSQGIACTLVGDECDKSVIVNCGSDACTPACPQSQGGAETCECSNLCNVTNSHAVQCCELTLQDNCGPSNVCPLTDAACSVNIACNETEQNCYETQGC